jgi:hypothetical protein
MLLVATMRETLKVAQLVLEIEFVLNPWSWEHTSLRRRMVPRIRVVVIEEEMAEVRTFYKYMSIVGISPWISGQHKEQI